ncbi:phage tail protein [Microtetraspora malaysiensis]|uniref:phage tail protein n=1 Tax=Microtetraspora malaysiensis TaxID=161358 RepID=UPI003D911ED4
MLLGLWNGFLSLGAWFRQQIYNFFSAIMPQWVRDALGIRSPSRVFAEIGKNTMLGLADGMTGTRCCGSPALP